MTIAWKCKKCGYVYDPRFGDAKSNIPKGTPFEEIPDTWVCPRCGALGCTLVTGDELYLVGVELD